MQQRLAIALPHLQKANCLQQRLAIAPHILNSELLAAAPRYRPSHPKQRTACSSACAIAPLHPQTAIAHN
ncbi:hypothetical protein PN478_16515 [Dolichospermum circinale CS-534/05]|uniref:hypothetical protein n=1 Tax=Dolichospermum circinale TaxID=109265 RepID=UPI00232D5C1A|nr:hypothetical protein [Dolichospermum circinale]MDB9492115.1 hypothetical protein [Dolichospermum circinale CS-534/05]